MLDTQRHHRRLVRLTRVLAVLALLCLIPLVSLLSLEDRSETIWPATLAVMGLVSCYTLVLGLARARRIRAARAALFVGWLLYLNIMLPLARPFSDLFWFEFMLLLASTMFFAMAIVGVVTLEPWVRARQWAAVFVLSFALNSLIFVPESIAGEELWGYVIGRALAFALLLGMSAAVLTLSRDLHLLLLGFEAQLESEQGLRLEAQEARAEAERSEQAKGRFLAHMSHEIRTPMNSVLGLSELLLDSPLAGQQRERIQVVHDSAHGLLTVINDVLAFSRADAVGIELALTAVDLRAMIDSIVESLRERASAAGLELDVLVSSVPDWVQADGGRLRQVLLNLLSNAIKFTREGRVELSCYGHGECVHFEVSDTGIGIAEQQQQRLFQPFAQADESINRRYGGTGLGLAISAQIVEAMGGAIAVDSALGEGTRIYFALELPAADAPASEPCGEASAAKPERAIEFRGRVLLVDDNAVNRMVGEAMVRALGCEIELVASGQAALAAVQTSSYALILLDCQMPDWDGFRTVAELRGYWEESGTKRSPVAALTAHATAGYRELCLSRGMDDYLAKPLSKAALHALFSRWELARAGE